MITFAFLLLAAACGSDDSSNDFATESSTGVLYSTVDAAGDAGDDGDFADAEAMEEEAAMADDAIDTPAQADAVIVGGSAAPVAAQLPDLGRDIIYTAELELGSTDVTEASRQAIAAVQSRGGYLFSQDMSATEGGRSRLVFKILPDQFQATLDELGSIGAVRSQSIAAEDVSAIVVDLQSRINTAEASVLRLRDLLDGAESIEVVAQLENQLLDRETTLERLRGQLRSVRDQVDLATITVTIQQILNQPRLQVATDWWAGHDAGFSCLDGGIRVAGEPGEPLTVCVRLTNVGDTALVDLELDEPIFGLTLDQLVVVEGDRDRLEIGESLLVAAETQLDESARLRVVATAVGVDLDGNELGDEVRAIASTLQIPVDEPEGLPGFGEVIRDSWNALSTAAVFVALAAVALAPWLVIAAALWFAARWLLRRQRARRPARAVADPQPPGVPTQPPAPTTPPAPQAAQAVAPTSAAAAAGESTSGVGSSDDDV